MGPQNGGNTPNKEMRRAGQGRGSGVRPARTNMVVHSPCRILKTPAPQLCGCVTWGKSLQLSSALGSKPWPARPPPWRAILMSHRDELFALSTPHLHGGPAPLGCVAQ